MFSVFKLIETRWHICSSGDWVIIDLGNSLASVRCQAITWTNDDYELPTLWHISGKF